MAFWFLLLLLLSLVATESEIIHICRHFPDYLFIQPIFIEHLLYVKHGATKLRFIEIKEQIPTLKELMEYSFSPSYSH